MTVDSAHYTEFFQQGQDVVRKSIDAWTRNAALVADPAIDRYFDLGEKVLEAQRDFAKSLMGAATSVGVGSHDDQVRVPEPAPMGANGTSKA